MAHVREHGHEHSGIQCRVKVKAQWVQWVKVTSHNRQSGVACRIKPCIWELTRILTLRYPGHRQYWWASGGFIQALVGFWTPTVAQPQKEIPRGGPLRPAMPVASAVSACGLLIQHWHLGQHLPQQVWGHSQSWNDRTGRLPLIASSISSPDGEQASQCPTLLLTEPPGCWPHHGACICGGVTRGQGARCFSLGFAL